MIAAKLLDSPILASLSKERDTTILNELLQDIYSKLDCVIKAHSYILEVISTIESRQGSTFENRKNTIGKSAPPLLINKQLTRIHHHGRLYLDTK